VDVSNKKVVSEALIHAAAALAGSSRVSMGIIREGEESFWPEPRGWDISDTDDRDVANAYGMVQYQAMSSSLSFVFVWFDARGLQLMHKKPGTYKAELLGREFHGTWGHEDEIPKILNDILKWAKQAWIKMMSEVKKLGGRDWEFMGSGGVSFVYPRVDSDGPHIEVDFPFIEEALSGGEEEAEISFYMGTGYEGRFGKKTRNETYSSIQDMKRILSKAEQYFKEWQE
jgi:hypothetical protein